MKFECCGSSTHKGENSIKEKVREKYGDIAGAGSQCGCCGPSISTRDLGKLAGYSDGDLASIPEGANLGLGCGNPTALGAISKGDTVLDLGSGAGIDCFLAAQKAGETGTVIGVDMTPEMISRARDNAAKAGYNNVEFRLGEIENLPVEDDTVDVVISNCVINLSPDKAAVFREAYRVMKPGGRFMVSDIVVTAELPDRVRESIHAYVGCVAGAELKERYLAMMEKSGFRNIRILGESAFAEETLLQDTFAQSLIDELDRDGIDIGALMKSVKSIKVSAEK